MRLVALLAVCPALLCAEGTQGWYQNNIWLRLNEQWSIGNYLDLRLFYLWRTTRAGQGWRNYHGLGVLASLNY